MRDTVRDYYEGRVAGPRVGTPWATGPASLVVGRTVPFSYEEHGWREYIHLWMDPVAVYPRPETAIPSLGGPCRVFIYRIEYRRVVEPTSYPGALRWSAWKAGKQRKGLLPPPRLRVWMK